MSSETSTEVRLTPDTPGDALQPWQLFMLAGLIGATVVVFVSRGQTPAGIILLSLTIFTAAAVGVAAWRTLAPFANNENLSVLPVLHGRTRAALEREKALVLRSIKELEFDRAMGKVSEKDFAEMSGRLRARAARLLRQLDASTGYRQQIEKEIETRVARAIPASNEAEKARSAGDVARACPSCGTDNDPDARFCKHCGASLEPSE